MDNLSLVQDKIELEALSKCNEKTAKYGLELSNEQAKQLVACHNDSLKKYRLVEFEQSILDKLVFTFCDSDYIDSDSYLETLEILQDIFYSIRSENEIGMSDEEVLEDMRTRFDLAGGDTDYMMELDLSKIEDIELWNQGILDSEMSRLCDD